MSSRVIVKARERTAEATRAASRPARRGQGGGQRVHPGGTVIARGLTRRRGLREPPSISSQLAPCPPPVGGPPRVSASNNGKNCLPAWHHPALLGACSRCPPSGPTCSPALAMRLECEGSSRSGVPRAQSAGPGREKTEPRRPTTRHSAPAGHSPASASNLPG